MMFIKKKKKKNLSGRKEGGEASVGAHKKYTRIRWGYTCCGKQHGPRKCPTFGKQYNYNGLQYFVRVRNTTTWTKMMATTSTMKSEKLF